MIKASTLIETLVAMVIIVTGISLAALAFVRIERAANPQLILEAKAAVEYEFNQGHEFHSSSEINGGSFEIVIEVSDWNGDLQRVEIQAITPSGLVLAKRTKIVSGEE